MEGRGREGRGEEGIREGEGRPPNVRDALTPLLPMLHMLPLSFMSIVPN